MFSATVTTPGGRRRCTRHRTRAAAERELAAMVERHIRKLPLGDLIAGTVLADGMVRVGGSTFRVEAGAADLLPPPRPNPQHGVPR